MSKLNFPLFFILVVLLSCGTREQISIADKNAASEILLVKDEIVLLQNTIKLRMDTIRAFTKKGYLYEDEYDTLRNKFITEIMNPRVRLFGDGSDGEINSLYMNILSRYGYNFNKIRYNEISSLDRLPSNVAEAFAILDKEKSNLINLVESELKNHKEVPIKERRD